MKRKASKVVVSWSKKDDEFLEEEIKKADKEKEKLDEIKKFSYTMGCDSMVRKLDKIFKKKTTSAGIHALKEHSLAVGVLTSVLCKMLLEWAYKARNLLERIHIAKMHSVSLYTKLRDGGERFIGKYTRWHSFGSFGFSCHFA